MCQHGRAAAAMSAERMTDSTTTSRRWALPSPSGTGVTAAPGRYRSGAARRKTLPGRWPGC